MSDPKTTRRWAMLALQLVGTGLAFAYVLRGVDLGALLRHAGAMPLSALLVALALTAINLVVGATRWQTLLAAYGAPHRPPLRRLVRLYYIGYFYNTYVPGGVGGDVVRGIVTREAFGSGGMARALTVVLVERVLGLVGLLLIVAVVLLWRPPAGLDEAVLPYTALGFAAAFAALGGVALARRIAPRLPGPLRRVAQSLPVLERAGPFTAALGLSLVTQTVVALSGWVLLAGLEPSVGIADAMVVVPIAAASAFLPITVGGAGAREAIFVYLTLEVTRISETASRVNEEQALAASLLLWGATLVVAAAGGALQLITPVASTAERRDSETPP